MVIPKTDIVQTSTAVDVEIYQNTESGYVAAQYARLQLNLKAREAYIRFNLSADAENYSLNHSNIVYLERTNATDVYVRPEIGYDVDFESTSDFNTKDYNISFDGESITWDSSKSFSYNNKLSVSRANSGYYYFKTLPGFVSGDHIYVSFQHKFTGAVNSLQFIYLDIDTLGLNNYRSLNISNLKQNENTGCIDLELNEVVALSFSYDNGVKYSVVEIYTFTMSDDGIVPTSSFGDQLTDETIVIEKVAEKIFLKAVALTKETNVYFGIKCEYWDLRYVRISEGTNRLVKFSVSNSVNDICVQKDGVETNYQEIGKAGLVSVDVVALPYGSSVINSQDITYTVTKDGVAVSDVTVTRNETTGKFDILSKLTSSGTYKIEFNYNEFKTSLYLVVK